MPVITAARAGSQNRVALLAAITMSELGAALINGSDSGYNVLVGSTPSAIHTFHSYADHPRIRCAALNSDAAGAYQIMSKWWPHYKAQLGLPDFGPLSQDLYAIQQMRERKALPFIDVGNLYAAVAQINNIWASLPGSPYGQHTNSMDFIEAAYTAAGGTLK